MLISLVKVRWDALRLNSHVHITTDLKSLTRAHPGDDSRGVGTGGQGYMYPTRGGVGILHAFVPPEWIDQTMLNAYTLQRIYMH